MMVNTKKLLFALVLGIGVSTATFAQSDKDRKNPPKNPPPTVIPKEKTPPPKEEKPKKPSMAVVVWKSEAGQNA